MNFPPTASGCLSAVAGVYQEWLGPWRRVAGMGDGISDGREPFRSEGEVCPLPEASGGPQPAQPGILTAAGGCPAPGDQHTACSCYGRESHHRFAAHLHDAVLDAAESSRDAEKPTGSGVFQSTVVPLAAKSCCCEQLSKVGLHWMSCYYVASNSCHVLPWIEWFMWSTEGQHIRHVMFALLCDQQLIPERVEQSARCWLWRCLVE